MSKSTSECAEAIYKFAVKQGCLFTLQTKNIAMLLSQFGVLLIDEKKANMSFIFNKR